MTKIKITEKTIRLAKAVTDKGEIVYFSKQNSSWYDYNIATRNVGDEFEAEIATSTYGNLYIQRLTADKFVNEVRIENALLNRDLLQKQIASI